MIELKSNYSNKENRGKVNISEDVVATISGTAAMEVDGVAGMSGNITDIAELIGKKNFSKGVKVEAEGDVLHIEINLYVYAEYRIHQVSREVQEKVKVAVETMTGLNVSCVDVTVSGIIVDKKNNKKDLKNLNE